MAVSPEQLVYLLAFGLAAATSFAGGASVAWVRDNPANRRLVEQYANSRIATFEGYFDDDWDRPECGLDADCRCDVEMYAYFGDGRDQDVYAANTGAEAEAGTEATAE